MGTAIIVSVKPELKKAIEKYCEENNTTISQLMRDYLKGLVEGKYDLRSAVSALIKEVTTNKQRNLDIWESIIMMYQELKGEELTQEERSRIEDILREIEESRRFVDVYKGYVENEDWIGWARFVEYNQLKPVKLPEVKEYRPRIKPKVKEFEHDRTRLHRK